MRHQNYVSTSFRKQLFTLLGLLCSASLLQAQAEVHTTIRNQLQQSWPWDPVYIEMAPAAAANLSVAQIQGARRPLQIEQVVRDGKPVARAWFVATIGEEEYQDDKGRAQTRIPKEVPVTLSQGRIDPGIRVRDAGDVFLIDNGVYEFRLRKSQTFKDPVRLEKVPHWAAGARVKGEKAWDGRAWFEGSAKVKAVHVELQAGPVFVDAHIVYDFVTQEDGTTAALPLELGKQTHLWKPNTPPREEIPKREHAYEVKLRFLMGHPLIDINERFHLPRDPDAGAFGIHQYWMSWGDPQDTPDLPLFSRTDAMPVDTVTWVRWFLYDVFGGNVTQNYVPAEPRPDQKGRPFALLRPRWNQGGGGAQDFVLTSGGSPSSLHQVLYDRRSGLRSSHNMKRALENADENTQAKVEALLTKAENSDLAFLDRYQAAADAGKLLGTDVNMPAENYSPDNPAAAVIATFPSKWVGPYPATIAAYAYDGNRGRTRFPLIDGERSGMHYGQRAYALGIAPRNQFHSLNDVVRTFCDWTLVAVHNKYITDWTRDPAKAGPHAYITRTKLNALRKGYESGKGLVAEIIGESAKELNALLKQKEELEPRVKELDTLRKDRNASDGERAQAEKQWNVLNEELKEINHTVNSTDMELLRMIVHNWSKNVGMQDATLWLQRRYQDDFLNPTQRATRNVKNFADADLFSAGEPIGGGMHAALGYITTDLDAWPGWHQGWSPGNPNFHTDKYMGAIYIGAALRDHPHADEWLEYGWNNFLEDVGKVLTTPDGVGVECPGYAGYALKLQLDLARILLNTGFGNPVTANPMFKASGVWHRKLITPFDTRLGLRHAAPIGDTHRWTSGLGHGFGALAAFYAKHDPAFASEMQGTWHLLLEEGGIHSKNRLKTHLIDSDPSIPPMKPEEMGWNSQAFHGFGAIMRNRFGKKNQESFLSIKAGPTHGHYHNDELAYHFYANGHPVSLDYNCSYAPRGDHAGLHNSMTFGNEGTVTHNQRNERVPGMEQIFGTAWVGAFNSTPVADVMVAERKSGSLSMSPLYPDDHEFGRSYDSREVDEIVHRRFLAMVKHPLNSPFMDFIVVRDETVSSEPQAVNIHMLARGSELAGNLVQADGQYQVDMVLFVAETPGLQIDNTRSWWYADDWMTHPGEDYTIRPGESIQDWTARIEAFKRKHKVNTLPLPGWKPGWRGRDADEATEAWRKLRNETDGKALIPPPGWEEKWLYGEYQHWVRLNTAGGTPVLWVLYPYTKGDSPPAFESLADGTGIRVTVRGQSQDIYLATDPAEGIAGQAVLRREGTETVLLPAGSVPALGQIPRRALDVASLDEE